MLSESKSAVSSASRPSGVVEHTDCERRLVVAVDDLPDDVGSLVSVEGRPEHLHLVVRLPDGPLAAEVLQEGAPDEADVPVEVGERAVPAEVGEDVPQRGAEADLGRVVAAVDRRVGLDVLRRNRRPYEREVVVDVRAAHDPRHDRVEERLRELRTLVIDEQADVEQLGFTPGIGVERARIELGVQPFDALAHTVVVEADSLTDRLLSLRPGSNLEPMLRVGAGLPKQAIVTPEALDHDVRDAPRDLARGRRGVAGRHGGA